MQKTLLGTMPGTQQVLSDAGVLCRRRTPCLGEIETEGSSIVGHQPAFPSQ